MYLEVPIPNTTVNFLPLQHVCRFLDAHWVSSNSLQNWTQGGSTTRVQMHHKDKPPQPPEASSSLPCRDPAASPHLPALAAATSRWQESISIIRDSEQSFKSNSQELLLLVMKDSLLLELSPYHKQLENQTKYIKQLFSEKSGQKAMQDSDP